jgi:hypothetical protein
MLVSVTISGKYFKTGYAWSKKAVFSGCFCADYVNDKHTSIQCWQAQYFRNAPLAN